MKEFYWDNSATTAMSRAAIDEYGRVAETVFGNPSSLHRKGVEAEKVLRASRSFLSSTIGAKEKEITFTSGGTEGNNLALRGIARAYGKRGRHIISTAVEHPAVLNTLDQLKVLGYEITLVPPNADGSVEPGRIREALRADTILVSMMAVNNETGSILPCAEIGAWLKSNASETFFHVDAVQSYGKMDLDVRRLGADALTVSAHKFHGPKGVGFLYLREGVRCQPLVFGGGQEQGIRPGTENTAGIAAMAVAAQITLDARPAMERLKLFKEAVLSGLEKRGVEFEVNGALGDSVPYILNISFPYIRSEVLLHSLESVGVYVSTGSACSSKKKNYSHVLRAMGLSEIRMESAIRLSWSDYNTGEALEEALDRIEKCVTELSKIMKRRK